MKNLIILIFCCSTISTGKLSAQNFTTSYLDSVKGFFRDWVGMQQDSVVMIADTTFSKELLDFFSEQFNGNYRERPIRTAYKRRQVSNGNNYKDFYDPRNIIDSIILTKSESKRWHANLEATKHFWLNRMYIPNVKVVDSVYYFKRLEAYHNSWNFTKAEHELEKTGYWTLSLPCFIRNGKYCIEQVLYYCGGNCGYEHFDIYEYVDSHWHKYGDFLYLMF